MTAPNSDPALAYAEAQRNEHQADIDKIRIAVTAVKGEMALLEDKLADMSRRLDYHVALRNLAQGVLDAAKLPPPTPETPPKPRAKPGEHEAAIRKALVKPPMCPMRLDPDMIDETGLTADQLRAPLRRMLLSGVIDYDNVTGLYRLHQAPAAQEDAA